MKWMVNILFVGWLAFPAQPAGQHFIGRHKSEVRALMEQQRKGLFEDQLTVNRVYNTLKYIDRLGNQTLLLVFSEQDTCLYSKWMCDYAMLNAVVADLNRKYDRTAEDAWRYVHDKQPYIVTLTEGDWYFTITTRKEQKDH